MIVAKVFLVLLVLCFSLQGNDANLDSFEDEFASEFSAPVKTLDPLSGFNRVMTGFNDFTYITILDPVARGYKYVVADEVRIFVYNIFDNLLSPMRFLNNLLQGKLENSGDELFRFVMNSTLGIGGIGDPAKIIWNVQRHDEDFGQTLGYYGVGSGFPVVLPFIGPSNLRDVVGLVGDSFVNPVSYVKTDVDSIALKAYDRLNSISLHVDDYGSIKKDALDLYPYLQDLYEKRREFLIKN